MTLGRLGPKLIDVCVLIFVICAVLQFAYSSVQGGLGLRVGFAAENEERQLQDELDALIVERQQLENLTYRLSDSYLDLDLLDERARDVLGYTRADELVVR